MRPPTRRPSVRAGVATAALACAGAVALAAPGAPDGSFGAGGRTVLVAPGPDRAAGVAVAPDGRIVVVGGGGPDSAMTVTRLGPDGAPDPAFGPGGTRRVDLGGVETGNAVAVAPDGSVVAAGSTSVGANVLVARFTPDGTPDPAFGAAGVRVIDHGGPDAAHAVALLGDGRIVVAGTGGAGRAILLTRLRPDGTPDPAFGGDGTAGIDLSGGEDAGLGVAPLPDGRTLVVGVTGEPSDAVFVRFTAGGSADLAFGIGGARVVDAGGADAARAVVRRPDGRMLAAGVGGRRGSVVVWGLDAVGRPDGSFGGAGAAALGPARRAESAAAVALQPNGKIVVAGSAGRDMLVARLHPGGAPDATFGRGGRRVVQLGGGGDAARAVAVQADGAIVAAGDTSAGDGDVAVVRLAGDPPLAAPRCGGREATIVGTPGRDLLVGTPRRDVIAALAGDDVVRARGGGDVVCGGAGDDRLVGGPGPDRLLGGAGADRLAGGPGGDRLRGGPGRDVCAGGPGGDVAACERTAGG